ncbi:MAG: hypothetical protein GKC10_04915 [Methanosarcinales archaeon]|nr:hypothetical protein [Methanosarcinales archaeon]
MVYLSYLRAGRLRLAIARTSPGGGSVARSRGATGLPGWPSAATPGMAVVAAPGIRPKARLAVVVGCR